MKAVLHVVGPAWLEYVGALACGRRGTGRVLVLCLWFLFFI